MIDICPNAKTRNIYPSGDTLYLPLTVILAFVWTATFAALAIKRYNAFNCGIDLGNIFQAFHNTLHGSFMQMTFEGLEQNICRLGGHIELLFIPLIPIVLLFNNQITLLVLQSIIIGFSSIIVYHLAKRKTESSSVAFLITASYLLFPLLPAIALADFHADPFFLCTIFLAFYFHETKNNPLFWIFIILSLFSKEYMALPVVLYGLYIIKDNRKKGLFVIGTSLLYYSLIVPAAINFTTDIPIAIKSQSHALLLPENLSIKQILLYAKTVLLPIKEHLNMHAIMCIFILFAYPVYKNKKSLIMILPVVFLLFSLKQGAVFSSHRHTLLIPLLFLGYIDAICKIDTTYARKNISLAFMCLTTLLFFISPASTIASNIKERFLSPEYRNVYHYKYTNHDRITDSIIETIPQYLSISAEDGIRAKMANRERLHLVSYPKNFTEADVHLFDFFEALTYTPWRDKNDRAAKLFNSQEFLLRANMDGLVIFQRKDSSASLSEFTSRFDTLSKDTSPDIALSVLTKQAIHVHGNRYKMITLLCKGALYKQGDALVSFFENSDGDTAKVLHTPSYILTDLKQLPQGLYREEFIFDLPAGFNIANSNHIIKLYIKDFYFCFFDRAAYFVSEYQ